MNIQQLSSYLPYGLMVQFIDNKKAIGELISLFNGYGSGDVRFEYGSQRLDIEDLKPILFPLSSLTKKIKIGGEEFVPSSTLSINEGFAFDACIQNISETGEGVENMPFWAIQKLFEWKIDVFSLIDKGEAISVYDLDKNPYE